MVEGISLERQPSCSSQATVAMPAKKASSLLENLRETSIALFPSIMSMSTPFSRSTRPVTYIVGCSAFALRNAVSSMPNEFTSSTRPEWTPNPPIDTQDEVGARCDRGRDQVGGDGPLVVASFPRCGLTIAVQPLLTHDQCVPQSSSRR